MRKVFTCMSYDKGGKNKPLVFGQLFAKEQFNQAVW